MSQNFITHSKYPWWLKYLHIAENILKTRFLCDGISVIYVGFNTISKPKANLRPAKNYQCLPEKLLSNPYTKHNERLGSENQKIENCLIIIEATQLTVGIVTALVVDHQNGVPGIRNALDSNNEYTVSSHYLSEQGVVCSLVYLIPSLTLLSNSLNKNGHCGAKYISAYLTSFN